MNGMKSIFLHFCNIFFLCLFFWLFMLCWFCIYFYYYYFWGRIYLGRFHCFLFVLFVFMHLLICQRAYLITERKFGKAEIRISIWKLILAFLLIFSAVKCVAILFSAFHQQTTPCIYQIFFLSKNLLSIKKRSFYQKTLFIKKRSL